MLNMTKSKYTNEEIFGGVAIAFVVVIAGYFMYKYMKRRRKRIALEVDSATLAVTHLQHT